MRYGMTNAKFHRALVLWLLSRKEYKSAEGYATGLLWEDFENHDPYIKTRDGFAALMRDMEEEGLIARDIKDGTRRTYEIVSVDIDGLGAEIVKIGEMCFGTTVELPESERIPLQDDPSSWESGGPEEEPTGVDINRLVAGVARAENASGVDPLSTWVPREEPFDIAELADEMLQRVVSILDRPNQFEFNQQALAEAREQAQAQKRRADDAEEALRSTRIKLEASTVRLRDLQANLDAVMRDKGRAVSEESRAALDRVMRQRPGTGRD